MKPPPFDRRSLPSAAAISEWPAPDGWKYRLLDWHQPESGERRGSLLFAGGRGDFIEKYVEALAHWQGAGWNVTALDWRGQGGSRGEAGSRGHDPLDILVEDLTALIRTWRKGGPGPHVAVAHSMGGHILLRSLAEKHVALDAAVLVAPMLMINSTPLPEWSAASLAAAATLFGFGAVPAWHQPDPRPPVGSFRQRNLTHSGERYDDELWWWDRNPGFNLGVPSWGWLRAAYRSMAKPGREALQSIQMPLLFIATEADRLVSPAAIRRAAGAVPSAELLMFDNALHEILREEDGVRQEALARIDRFFDERAAK